MLRDRYGRTPYGQSVLLARRLVEAGVRFVTVYYSPGIVGWDTHEQNFKLLRERLLPATEQTLPTLIQDLEGAACSTRRWSSGRASSAAPRRSTRMPAATTGPSVTPC